MISQAPMTVPNVHWPHTQNVLINVVNHSKFIGFVPVPREQLEGGGGRKVYVFPGRFVYLLELLFEYSHVHVQGIVSSKLVTKHPHYI